MATVVTIFDRDGAPLSGDVEIESDAGFAAIERSARAIADSGTACCIAWYRDEDGQRAYWGPSGASIAPQWYASNR